jgi:hypothetical protein
VFVPGKALQPSLVFREKHSSLLRKPQITTAISFTIQAPDYMRFRKLINILIFHKWIRRGPSCRSKSPCGLPKISKILSSTSNKTSWSAPTVTFSKDRQIGPYSIGLTIPGILVYLNKKEILQLLPI